MGGTSCALTRAPPGAAMTTSAPITDRPATYRFVFFMTCSFCGASSTLPGRGDPDTLEGPYSVHLDDGLARGQGEVGHALRHRCIRSGGQVLQRSLVVFIAHAEAESTLQDRDVLVDGVPMRRHPGPRGELDPERERCSRLRRIALHHADLRRLRQRKRRRSLHEVG